MGNSIANLDFMLWVVLIPRDVINNSGDKPRCIQSERYLISGGLAEKQRLVQALLCTWRYSLCLHTQLPEHNRSYWKVSQGWGHLITWNGPMMGHLNSFSASGGRNLNKNFPKIQMPGGLPAGWDVEASIWLVHYASRSDSCSVLSFKNKQSRMRTVENMG